MSQLDELIAEFCPNGVEYKTIDEIAVDIYIEVLVLKGIR